MRSPKDSRGFSLLEVLIAVLVFSFGLLGVAGLMVLSVRTNHSAYLRTQASFLAESMVNRMHTNVGWTSSYKGTYDASTATGAGDCDPCSPEALVERDRAIWSQQLVDFLPAPSATIECVGNQLGIGSTQLGAAPFDGLCTMTIEWTEAGLGKEAGSTPAKQTFAWVFQP